MEFIEPESKSILDSLSTSIFVIDKNFTIVYCNRAFEKMIMNEKENIIGKPCFKISHNSDVPCWEMKEIICPSREAFAKNEKFSVIHKHTVNDALVVEEVVSTPINNGKYVIEELRNLSELLGLMHGMLRICAGCKKIQDDQGNWHQPEGYLHNKTGADFTHSLCPDCAEGLYPGFGHDK